MGSSPTTGTLLLATLASPRAGGVTVRPAARLSSRPPGSPTSPAYVVDVLLLDDLVADLELLVSAAAVMMGGCNDQLAAGRV